MWTTIGHDWAVELLGQAIAAHRLAHSYLIAGPEQIGKTHLAIELAAALNCRASQPPCQGCSSCQRTMAGRHPDVTWIQPERDRILIEQVRNLPYELSLSPVLGKWRVCVLSDFHRATPEAANALLKTLEEPPAHAVLILTATDPSLLLPTIVSRCQILTLRPVSQTAIAGALVQQHGLPRDRAEHLARLAGGRVGWAIAAAGSPSLLEQRSGWIEQLLSALQSTRAQRLDLAETLAKSDALPEMLRTWETVWRDVLLLASGAADGCTHTDYAAPLEALAQAYSVGEASIVIQGILSTQKQLDQNANTRLALEVLLLGWRRPPLAGAVSGAQSA
jgi:DNA polymerase-3 subunit delta'